jgi:uncharacterized protein
VATTPRLPGPDLTHARSRGRPVARAAPAVAVLAGLVAQAELIVAFINVPLGLAVHGLLLAGLLAAFPLVPRGPLRRVLPALALLPLLRILSLTVPIPALPPLAWHALVGLPLLAGIVLAARASDLRPADLGLRLPPAPGFGWRVALAGIPLGIVAALAAPRAIPPADGPNELVLGVLLAFTFAGVVEELLFRGVLQRVLRDVYGRWAFVVANLLFMAAYLPTLSAPLIAVMGAAGILFGWSVARSGSVWPAAVGHGLLVAVVVVWPVMLS